MAPVTFIMAKVMDERNRQNAKWGEQNHAPPRYFAILCEEVGEVAKEVVELDTELTNIQRRIHMDNYRAELIHVAAVAVAMIEACDRKRAALAQPPATEKE